MNPGRCALLGVVLAAAIGLAPRAARADEAAAPSTVAVSPLTVAVAAGRHWRLETPHGVVHVWIPDGYDSATGAVVVYVHGYYTDVDGAWTNHQLPEQFALSGVNAIFIACEAPSGPHVPVSWRSLPALLRTVRAATGEHLPRRLAVIGHSGAFRTLISWLRDPEVDTIALIDAVYEPDPFRAWIRASRRRRLIDIGEDTSRYADQLHRSLPSTVVVDALPPPEAGALPPAALAARIVYIRSQVGHMPLVTGGVALPMVLRALSIASLASGASSEPLGILPPLPEEPTAAVALVSGTAVE